MRPLQHARPTDGGLGSTALVANETCGQRTIRIDQQWRICFTWTDAGPHDVEIVDHHEEVTTVDPIHPGEVLLQEIRPPPHADPGRSPAA